MELCSMSLRSLEETLVAFDSSVGSDYLAGPLDWHVRYEPNGELLVAGGDADAPLANSNSIHVVGTSSVS